MLTARKHQDPKKAKNQSYSCRSMKQRTTTWSSKPRSWRRRISSPLQIKKQAGRPPPSTPLATLQATRHLALLTSNQLKIILNFYLKTTRKSHFTSAKIRLWRNRRSTWTWSTSQICTKEPPRQVERRTREEARFRRNPRRQLATSCRRKLVVLHSLQL